MQQQIPVSFPEETPSDIIRDQPPILPDWTDGDYHDYEKMVTTLSDYTTTFPELAYQFSIGKSVDGRDIWCLRITNEQASDTKYACLIDGCIHGNEWEGGEACLYLAEYLLINFGKNATLTRLLNTTEVYIIPMINPDGRVLDQRWNDNGIDLNRNFDVKFGRLSGRSIRIGKLFGIIKIPHIGPFTNCGRRPFSEPESKAVRDFIISLYDEHEFSFYLDCHTAQHMIVHPWTIFRPPFKITAQQQSVFTQVESWVENNTEYPPFRGKHVYTSGDAMNWVFKEFQIPSFTLELLSRDYEPMYGHGRHNQLVHWMEITLPITVFLIVNIENLYQWQEPTIQPPLPEGVPSPPLSP